MNELRKNNNHNKDNKTTSEERASEKKSLLHFKSLRVTNADYRGLLAFSLVLLFAYALFTDNLDAEIILGSLVGSVIGFYFATIPEKD